MISKSGGLKGEIPKSNHVITDSKAWRDLLSKIGSDRVTETDVDFNRFTVIAVSAGVISSGAQINITRICEQENSMTVVLAIQRQMTTVMSNPFEIVRIPKTSKPFVFECERATYYFDEEPTIDTCENGGYVFSPTAKNRYYYYKGEKTQLQLDTAWSKRYNIPCFRNMESSSGQPMIVSNIFFVELKSENDVELLNKVAREKNVSIVEQNEFMPVWYTLKIADCSLKSSLELSNEFYETGYFASIGPGFASFKYDVVNCDSD